MADNGEEDTATIPYLGFVTGIWTTAVAAIIIAVIVDVSLAVTGAVSSGTPGVGLEHQPVVTGQRLAIAFYVVGGALSAYATYTGERTTIDNMPKSAVVVLLGGVTALVLFILVDVFVLQELRGIETAAAAVTALLEVYRPAFLNGTLANGIVTGYLSVYLYRPSVLYALVGALLGGVLATGAAVMLTPAELGMLF